MSSQPFLPEYFQELSRLWQKQNYGDIERLRHLLTHLYIEIETFGSCVSIIAYSRQVSSTSKEDINNLLQGNVEEWKKRKQFFKHWPHIATREAMATFYQISTFLYEVSKILNNNNATQNMKNINIASDICQEFRSQFGWEEWKNPRDASQHRAEKLTEILGINRTRWPNSIQEYSTYTYQYENLQDYKYTTTQKGKTVTFEVTWEKYDKLLSFYDHILEQMRIEGVPGPTADKR